jgi:hypothetical protein
MATIYQMNTLSLVIGSIAKNWPMPALRPSHLAFFTPSIKKHAHYFFSADSAVPRGFIAFQQRRGCPITIIFLSAVDWV